MSSRRRAPARAVAPVVGVLALVFVTACLAAVVAVAVGSVGVVEPVPAAAFELGVDSDEGSVALTHLAGEPLCVRDVTLTVTVEGEPLAEQPPVPFFAADGFRGGPEGPFNEAADPEWRVGETATVRVAETNDPSIEPGDTVRVTVAVDGETIARLETTAR